MFKPLLLKLLDNIESYICQTLLAFFVIVLFLQIVFREMGFPLSWSEEIARFSFVWFVFFGASYAARLGAHNRVSLQFKLTPKWVGDVCMLVGDMVWILFNAVMIWQGVKVIQALRKFPYASPALDWQLWIIYLIFPISFTLMTLRIIQVNYMKFVLKLEIEDPDKVAIEQSKHVLDGGR